MPSSPFYGGIKSYDVHTYWNNNSETERNAAFDLREKFLREFKSEVDAGDIKVYKFWDKPIGPHPINMWELDFHLPESFVKVVPWFQMNHGKLLVLIHPHLELGEFKDHTDHALWLGHKVRLDTEVLSRE